jgi:two-component sensor histidine kinase
MDDPSLAQTIVESVREPLLALDERLNIRFASSSFHRSFQISAAETHNRPLFGLDGGAWDIPELRSLLERCLSKHLAIEGFEIAHEFPRIGRRVLLLHISPTGDMNGYRIILGFEDVTDRRLIEQEKAHLQSQTDGLLRQKEMLLEEMEHRILNSLQIIASILMLKARTVASEETREQLQDAHRRVLSVAAVQRHLHVSGRSELVEVAPYLTNLCASLAGSMLGEGNPDMLKVIAGDGRVTSAQAVSLGLIVTELLINALKHAFPRPGAADAVVVCYQADGADWKLSVSDNGVGQTSGGSAGKGGLGTSLVKALAQQLDAQVETTTGPAGMRVSVAHSTLIPLLAQVA